MAGHDRGLVVAALLGALAQAACVAASDAEALGYGETAGDSDANATGPADVAPEPARGISILEVEINQGTRIPIGTGGQWIDTPERLGELIASRDSIMRIHYVVDDGWEPREIEARLRLDFPDGTQTVLTDQRLVERDSSRADIDGPFRFALASAQGQTVAGTTYRVELWDLRPDLARDALAGDAANPAEGAQPIGFETVPMQIKSLLVPITYQGTTAALDEATTTLLLDNLYEQNPVTEILYDVHEPLAYDSQLTNLASLLPVMAELRTQEAAEPNVYYHALVNVGSQSLAGNHGISSIADDSQGDAGSRVSATVLWMPNPSIAADTYTHETGHAQGLSHVACPNGEAAEPDASYPHADGSIGNWGFGVRRTALFDPADAYDYMSYCAPSWVSDWTWNKTYQRIQTLTAWDFGGPDHASEPPVQLLVGVLHDDGTRQWWTMPGTIDPARVTGRDRVEFETAGGEHIEVLAEVSELSDGRTLWLEAALPVALDELVEIRHVSARAAQTVVELDVIDPSSLGRELGVDLGHVAARQPEWKIFRPR